MNIKKNKFGNISDMLEAGQLMAVELGNFQPKTINYISASFCVPDAETLASKPFKQGLVVVFRGRAEVYPYNGNITEFQPTQNFEYVRFFNSYEGFNDTVFISAGKDDVLTVIMYSALLQDVPDIHQDCFASLSVFGSFGDDKKLFEVV